MSTVDHSHRSHAERESSPTRTSTLQREYRVDVEKRFRALRGVVRETVERNNALGLNYRSNDPTPVTRSHDADDIGPRKQFPFEKDVSKQIAFRQQFRQWIDAGILEPIPESEVIDGNHYTASHVRAGYDRGLDWAHDQLAEVGRDVPGLDVSDAFDISIHKDTIEDLYLRNFQALEGITSDMDREISRILSRSFAEGVNPRVAADRMTGEIHSMQRGRARTMARTELLKNFNTAAGTRYQEFGVQQVRVLTHDPCPVCESLAAQNPWPADAATGIVPDQSHPACVCSIAPVI